MDPELGRFISEDQMNDPNNPNLYTYCRNNPLIFTDPSGNFSLNDVFKFVKNLFGIKDDKNDKKKIDKKSDTNSNSTQTNTTNYVGDQPTGDPVGYQEFPGPPPVKFPIYTLDQLPASIRDNYDNQVDPTDNTIMYVPPGMENAKISEHFTIKEFMSEAAATYVDSNGKTQLQLNEKGQAYSIGKDRFIRLNPELITNLEDIRSANGNQPMSIHEGYRTIIWQKALTINGYPTAGVSPHTAGIAADFDIGSSSVSGRSIANTILGKMPGRVGVGNNWIHYDVGDKVYGPNYGVQTKAGVQYPYFTGNTWNY